MSKEELYDALRADGARLKPANFYSKDALADIYAERFGTAPQTSESTEQKNSANELDDTADEIRTLYFAFGGWCEEISASFAPGYKKCRSKEEYQALKKYAAKVL